MPATGETTVFVYDASGKLEAEYSTNVVPVQDAKVSYLTADHLGSPRITTDALGQVISRHDYHPFGEEIFTAQRTTGLNYSADSVRKQFTGYERDPETSLDFAQARMYSYRLGRFISEDSFPADIFTPQTWSRYQYCLNNPLHFIDSLGRYDEDVHRDLVAALAYVVGFSESQGNTIANADQWLDDSRSGHTAMPLENGLRDWTGYEGRRDYHFTTEARRLELWGAFEGTAIRGSGDAALEALGTYLHAEQDSYSHEGFDPGLGQVASVGDNLDLRSPIKTVRNRMKEMEKYDKTWNDPEKAVQMARDTLAKLLAARNLLDKTRRVGSLQTSVPWETDKFINEKLRLWAKTTGTTPEDERNKKRNILFEIMQYVTDYRSRQKDDDQKKKL
ncbi:MAG: cell well associated RhsD protein [Acidobacteria bacterium OLB17]|nr:MAG: cell well associated RhsD protein [Acidobacteria bacterium OLB17]